MIPEKNPYNNWQGNGSATTFDFDFYIENEGQLAVYHTNNNGVQTRLVYNRDYSIHEFENENGSYITFPLKNSSYSVLGDGEVLSLCLTLPISQLNPFGKSSYLDLKTLEYSLDYLTRLCQIMNRELERSVKTQEGSSQSADELIEALQQAQVNAQNSASAAASSAQEANNSAIAAGEEATIATQQAAIVEETYNTAIQDIAQDKSDAISAIASARSSAESSIAVNKEDALNEISQEKTNFDTQYNNASSNLQNQFEDYTENLDGQLDVYLKNYDRLYQGVNLETKFASEIAQAGNVYAWLENRKNAGNFEGIHVGDYFYTSIVSGTVAGYSIAAQTFKCRIVGINTYKSCADTNIGNMFYIITDEVINTPIKWNPTDNNNGTSSQTHPWLASAMYAVLNGVNNYTTAAYGNAAHGANASAKGILQLLPSTLQAVMKQKRNLLDARYSSSGLLTGGTGWDWSDMGKLWLPNEYEVYGCAVRSNLCLTNGYWHPEAGLSIQFPWFANNCEHRIKKNSSGGRCNWWLSSVASNNAAYVCLVNSDGIANSFLATNAPIYAPLCFCI